MNTSHTSSAPILPELDVNDPYVLLNGDLARKVANAPSDLLDAAVAEFTSSDEFARTRGGTRVPGVLPELDRLGDWAASVMPSVSLAGFSVANVWGRFWTIYAPGDGIDPHSDGPIPGVTFTLGVYGSDAGFRLGGRAEGAGPGEHSDYAIDLPIQPGELWVWNGREIHSVQNKSDRPRLVYIFRACIGYPDTPWTPRLAEA